jgi:hypothetical protein
LYTIRYLSTPDEVLQQFFQSLIRRAVGMVRQRDHGLISNLVGNHFRAISICLTGIESGRLLCDDGARGEYMRQKLTPQIISAAISGFEQQKAQIDVQIAELRAMLSEGRNEIPPATVNGSKRRIVSARARRKMAEAQKARWAKSRGKAETEELPAPKAKRKLSAAARATMAANLKKARAAKARKARLAARAA